MNQTAPSWLAPAPEHQGLRRYVETIRERIWLVVLCSAALAGAALVYGFVVDSVYEARADLLITPVPADSVTLTSLGLLRESFDPAREIDTATQLVTTTAVAELVDDEVADGRTPGELLELVEALPVAQSNIVALTAEGSSSDAASELANGFAAAAIEQRTEALYARIDEVLPDLRDQLEELPVDSLTAQEVAAQVGELETLRAGDDPTVSLATPASPPESASSPKRLLLVVGAGLVGLTLGVLATFALRLLDPRLRREEQLRELFQLPVLARVPNERSRSKQPLGREKLSAAAAEAYRTLRATLVAGRSRSGPTSILITGPSAAGGKTTTAINLATALAVAGKSVILIETDLRRPSIAGVFGIETEQGLVSVLLEESTLDEALISIDTDGGSLRLLLADATGPSVAELIALPMTRQLVDDAKDIADYVVLDSPPLTEVIDALPLVGHVDEVVIVLRLGHSNLRQTKELGELIAGAGGRPAGVALLGVERRGSDYYYYAPERPPKSGGRKRPLSRAGRNGS
ncbi:MAG: AAA family ATPase [Actinomycetota bacterium]|nr:AAA family ATPase [Actinomycetota bacterium]